MTDRARTALSGRELQRRARRGALMMVLCSVFLLISSAGQFATSSWRTNPVWPLFPVMLPVAAVLMIVASVRYWKLLRGTDVDQNAARARNEAVR